MTTTRIARIAVGYAVACAAAALGCLLLIALFAPAHPTGSGRREVLGAVASAIASALLPGLAAVVFAEHRRIRSAWAHAGMGAAVGAAAAVLYAAYGHLRLGVDTSFSLVLVFPAALLGMIGGLAYHVTAGRKAGGG